MSRARTAAAGGAVVIVGLVIGVYLRAVTELRWIEAAHVESRQPTACVIEQVAGFGFDSRPDRLLAALPPLIEQGGRDVRLARRRFDDRTFVVPLPPLLRARRGAELAGGRLTELYTALERTPESSNDELARFTTANRLAERRIAAARGLLRLGDGAGWDDRNRCRATRG